MRYRYVSLCVEWTDGKDIGETCAFLNGSGACGLAVDEDMDLQYIPGQSFRHAHTVFRFRVRRTVPVHELLSALAMRPGVYSVAEIGRIFR